MLILQQPYVYVLSLHSCSVRQWTHENGVTNRSYNEVDNGVSMCLYQGYPTFICKPAKRLIGYIASTGTEDLTTRKNGNAATMRPKICWFQLLRNAHQKGESITFSAGIAPIKPNEIDVYLEKEIENLDHRDSFYHCLVNAAHQFRVKKGDENYIITGYPLV